jgi:hypothetical protein
VDGGSEGSPRRLLTIPKTAQLPKPRAAYFTATNKQDINRAASIHGAEYPIDGGTLPAG